MFFLSDLHQKVLNVLAYDPINKVYYGISTNKKTFLRSKSSPFVAWRGISTNIWTKAKQRAALITATEVPFVPVLKRYLNEPYEALTVTSDVTSNRRRRSVANNDMWGCNYLALVFCFLIDVPYN